MSALRDRLSIERGLYEFEGRSRLDLCTDFTIHSWMGRGFFHSGYISCANRARLQTSNQMQLDFLPCAALTEMVEIVVLDCGTARAARGTPVSQDVLSTPIALLQSGSVNAVAYHYP